MSSKITVFIVFLLVKLLELGFKNIAISVYWHKSEIVNDEFEFVDISALQLLKYVILFIENIVFSFASWNFKLLFKKDCEAVYALKLL